MNEREKKVEACLGRVIASVLAHDIEGVRLILNEIFGEAYRLGYHEADRNPRQPESMGR